MNARNVLDEQDYRGKRVIFSRKRWKTKSLQHPELLSPKFMLNLVKTVNNPEEVWEDYADPKNRRCYYKRYSVNTYIKAVIWTTGKHMIITAFETNFIKETKYYKLRRLV